MVSTVVKGFKSKYMGCFKIFYTVLILKHVYKVLKNYHILDPQIYALYLL